MKQTIGRRFTAALLVLALWVGMIPVVAAAPAATVQSVTLSSNTLSMKVGETKDLTATVTMSDNTAYSVSADTVLPSNMKITWSVKPGRESEVGVSAPSNSLKATVTALDVAATNADPKEVAVTVTVTMNGVVKTADCNVLVSSAEQAGVTIEPSSLDLVPGSKSQLHATVKPSTASQDVTWSSGNNQVATVDALGWVTGVAAGQTVITATTGTNVANCTVTVPGIVLKDSAVTLRERQNYTLQYTIFGTSYQKKQIQWSTSDSKIVQVSSGYLYAVSEGTATITAKISGTTFQAACQVKVERNTADVISASVDAGTPLHLSGLRSKIQEQCTAVLGSSLLYVSGLSVSTAQGTLYYRYQSDADTGAGVGTGERYYVSPGLAQRALDDVTFVPQADFSGTAVISYTGYADAAKFFQGTIEVTVGEQGDIVYNTSGTKPIQFNADDFNRLCRNRTGRDLRSVTFSLPSSTQGTLYYRYISANNNGGKVSSTKEYSYSGTPNLSDVYFVPASGRTGEAIVSFTARDTYGSSFRGRVRILVSAATQTGDLNYSISQGGKLTLSETDFDNLSRQATGYSMDYVRFTPPSSSCGTLYYNYTSSGSYDSAVSADRSYYRSSSPYLRRITFVAATAYSGTVEIPFRIWDTKGNQFSGTMCITVGATGNNVVRYSTYRGGKVTFNDDDFNSLCSQAVGGTLRYVRFTLPASSQGTLYYNYQNGTYDSKVSATTSYYRSSSPYLDKVTFVAQSSYTGTVSIPFTGWNTNGKTFSGTVEIGVDSSASQIAYQVRSGGAVTMVDTDFNRLCEYETGESLRYVRFTLPSSSRGILYYDYNDQDGSYASKISSGTSYYYNSSPYLARVTFVADDAYSGVLDLAFDGWSTSGKKFSGTVQITVDPVQSASVIYYSAANGTVDFQSRDFVSACASRGLGSLASVRFTLPSSSTGRLLYGSGSSVQSTTNYYPSTSPSISDVYFVAATGYQGTAILTYTGTDSRGNTYQGQICIAVQANQSSRYFDDLGDQQWAISSVDLLYERGIVTGTSNRTYSPKANISRGDFVLMLSRTFSFPAASSSSFSDVPAGSYYAGAIASAKALGIADGYPDGGFHPRDPISRQDAMVLLKRAMTVNGWSLGSGQTSVLDGYWDGKQVASYAEEAVATMLRYGILTGTPEGMLNPRDPMSRAEMAVVLARVLAL